MIGQKKKRGEEVCFLSTWSRVWLVPLLLLYWFNMSSTSFFLSLLSFILTSFPDSFVLMRKEQQKSLQEKQKMSLEKHKAGNASDLCESSEGNKEEKGLLGVYSELDVSTATTPILSNESEKSSFSSNASRPPVPPGFTNNILEKSSDTNSLVPFPLAEVCYFWLLSMIDCRIDHWPIIYLSNIASHIPLL